MKTGNDQEIVRWREEDKKSFREIGHILGISHVAVRKRYIKTANQQGPRLLVNVDVQAVTQIGQGEVNGEKKSKLETSTNSENTEARLLSNVYLQEKEGSAELLGNASAETITNNNIPLKEVEPIRSSLKSASHRVTKEEYLINKQTGRVVRKGISEPHGDLVPYTPPKFLRKIDGQNKGKLFPWTFYLAQRIDMMPFEDDTSNLNMNQVTNQQEVNN